MWLNLTIKILIIVSVQIFKAAAIKIWKIVRNLKFTNHKNYINQSSLKLCARKIIHFLRRVLRKILALNVPKYRYLF